MIIQDAPEAESERVEESDFDTGMRVERREPFVHPEGVVVVEQHADAHAAICRSLQCFAEQDAGEILLPDVVLHIDGTIGGVDQQSPSRKCIDPIRQRDDS